MKKNIVLILLFLVPFSLPAQENPDAVEKRKCDDKVFVKAEVLPGLKEGNKIFEDSLTSYLKERNAFHNATTTELNFIVTKESKLVDVTQKSDEESNAEIIKEALLHFSGMWTPATQNHHIVCSYVTLKIQIEKDTLTTRVFQ